MVKLPSLRHILLKDAAINFDNIFLDTDPIQGHVFKKDIHLPPYLFENIMSKGNESGWPIPPQFLKHCLAYRDALNWENLNILHGTYEVKDLLKIQDAQLPLKQLSFRVFSITPELVKLIIKCSPSLEVLNIGYYDIGCRLLLKNLEKFEEGFDEFKTPLKFPKLKKLIISFQVLFAFKIAYIDFTSCSETLESLEFHDFFVSYPGSQSYCEEHFLASCSEMRKLKSITFCDLRCSETDTFYEHLEKIKSLRSLNLERFHYDISGRAVGIILDALPQLESLTVTNSQCEDNDISRIKSKNLKYFGIWEDYYTRKDKTYIPGIEKYAQTIILRIVRQFSVVFDDDAIKYANKFVFKFADRKNQWTTDFKKTFSNLISNFALHLKFMETLKYVWIFNLWETKQMLDFIMDYITRNTKTTTAIKYLTYLFLSNIAFTTSNISTLEFLNLKVKLISLEYREATTSLHYEDDSL